ncbi:hypothetical protein AVEN_139264-1 [Araneus ventricosus]|uniref:Uncharacterized protein n=1 Tax=Araneus ventricosus TaxID=182803 RepID=A0A4Y2SIA1_ARAVE|nr:hypothetical protein AVEN_139264-1 [Araneus ventricosus]
MMEFSLNGIGKDGGGLAWNRQLPLTQNPRRHHKLHLDILQPCTKRTSSGKDVQNLDDSAWDSAVSNLQKRSSEQLNVWNHNHMAAGFFYT